MARRRVRRADVVAFPELAVTGYLPEDLLLKPDFIAASEAAVEQLAASGPPGCVAVVGYARREGELEEPDWDVTVAARDDLRNSAAVLGDGRMIAVYDKSRLPNYGVFDEGRYFPPDEETLVVDVAAVRVGITVCEDLWDERGPITRSAAAGAQLVVNINASPFHAAKRELRERWITHHCRQDGVWLAYVNEVGAHDEVVFDGDSAVYTPDGAAVARAVQFEEQLLIVDLPLGDDRDLPALPPRDDPRRLGPVEEVWRALIVGTRGYCHKNGFRDAVIGLSGGVDSAVTAAVAADALGADHVLGVAMPSPHSSDHSLSDAKELAATLGIRFEVLPIAPAMDAYTHVLADVFARLPEDITEENLQARIRGTLLMALSNKFGSIVLTTGNKSEMAVGYATLYGDMAGGFAVLKDCPKLLVYELARYRNSLGPAIPEASITKPPSAELRPGQLDVDSLPPYEVLDPILEAYVEDDLSVADIVARGYDEEVVRRVVRMVDRAEYKRRQAPPGVKISDRAFGKDRRLPITNGWRS